MNIKKVDTHNFFFIVIAILITFSFVFMVYRYINTFALSIILALIISPLNKYLVNKFGINKVASTILSIIIATLIVLLPIYFAVSALVADTLSIIRSIQDTVNNSYIDSILIDYNNLLIQYDLNNLQLDKLELSNSLRDIANTFSASLINTFNFVLKTSYNSVINFFMFILFTTGLVYYWEPFKKYIIEITPLDDEIKNIYFKRLNLITWDVIKGTFILAVIQAFVAGIFLHFTGVPNAFLWSVLVMVFSIVPVLGSSMVTVPIAVFYILTGNYILGLSILLWQILVVGTIDNIIRPFIVSEEIRINPIIILFAFLAGLSAFGPIGIFYGPIIVILFLTTMEIISKVYYNKDVNFFKNKIYTKKKEENTFYSRIKKILNRKS